MKPQQNVQRTVESSNRRRALFPSDKNSSDSDLGCIIPLNYDDRDVFSLDECVGDYDIIGLVQKSGVVNTPKGSLNNFCDSVATPNNSVTEVEESPTQKLKTPQDLSDNTQLPKLTRKTFTDISASSSEFNKSKVCTALFPDMSLSPKTFYKKTELKLSPNLQLCRKSKVLKKCKKEKLYLCSRKKFNGQINKGVSHKIKKIKRLKKINKISTMEAAVNIIENSPLNNVLNSSENLSSDENIKEPSPEPIPDPSKTFFKSPSHKAVFKLTDTIQLTVNKGKISLKQSKRPLDTQNENNSKRIKLTNDFENEKSEPLISQSKITNLISTLEEDKENSKNKEESVVLMSPTSQMCDMTSGLALNSPKKGKNLNTVLENMSTPEQKRFFPIFYPGRSILAVKSDYLKNNNGNKKFKGLAKGQMLLDAGQKKFGVTQCPECSLVYHMGDPGDEIMHINYHNGAHHFKFNGWRNERVVFNDQVQNRIIRIVPNDPKLWWKKVRDVMVIVNRDLGFYDITFDTSQSQIFLYIKNKTIVGVLVAEVKTTAYKLLTTENNQVDLCSEESYPIKCGVSRIWVSYNYRKKGIATALMNSLKRNFLIGTFLRNEDIALSTPTEMGKLFGKSYFKTPNFLIYFV